MENIRDANEIKRNYPNHLNFKPKNGTTKDNPFSKGTGGSDSFRIPSMVTLNSGRIVAAADARWNSTYDGGGIDTLVSYSDDDGENWNYSFANYLGDNGNEYSGSRSTCFIDPCLITDGNNLWLMCDLDPYGIAFNGKNNTHATSQTGFDTNGNLLLSDDNHITYRYYLNMKDRKIYSLDGMEQTKYTVDSYFNIFGADVNSNLFFEDSPLKVQRTSYIYLTKSIDGGVTWSSPTLINLKQDGEQAVLVGPGKGLYTKDGILIVPCYTFIDPYNPKEYTCFLYSIDGGNTWKRNANVTSIRSSESGVVELEDGTLRFFFRHISESKMKYIDAVPSGNVDNRIYNWKDPVTTMNIVNSACEISAITYSKTINGKQAILVSCPTGPNESGSTSCTGGPYSEGGMRLNGKIFIGLVEDDTDKSMTWLSPFSINKNNAEFMYSCITELKNGNIAILYEDHQNGWGAGSEKYYTMQYKTFPLSSLVSNATGSALTEFFNN